MTSMRASRLFHTIVVVGASIGCGGSDATSVVASGGPAPLDAARSLSPRDCASTAQYACDPSGACACNVQAPQSPCDCARPGEFRCEGCVSGPPMLGRCPYGDGTGCFCNTSIAVAAPTDCEQPQQFTCRTSPAIGNVYDAGLASVSLGASLVWYDFADCSCDPTRPLGPADCPANTVFVCSSVADCSASSAAAPFDGVRFDCSCVPEAVPIP